MLSLTRKAGSVIHDRFYISRGKLPVSHILVSPVSHVDWPSDIKAEKEQYCKFWFLCTARSEFCALHSDFCALPRTFRFSSVALHVFLCTVRFLYVIYCTFFCILHVFLCIARFLCTTRFLYTARLLYTASFYLCIA